MIKAKEHIKNLIEESIKNLSYPEVDIHVEHPKIESHGDYATNVSMLLSKKVLKNPRDVAEDLKREMESKDNSLIHNIDIAGPGFINFSLKKDFFAKQIDEIFEKRDEIGQLDIWKGKKVLVEHSSPNLFKPFHIGHMMNNTIGEAFVRLSKISGADTTVISYPSDVSLGIGKAVWKLLDYGVEKLDDYETRDEKISFLGRCYAEGTKALKENPELEERIREITQDIYEKRDTEAYRAYEIGKKLNLDYFVEMTELLGSHFDDYIFESEAGKVGKELVLANLGTIFKKSAGAIVFEPSEEDLEKNPQLHTRVFINRDGNPTYEAKDLGLLKLKFERYQPELSLFVTDHEQGPYFSVVSFVAGKIQQEWKDKTVHLTHGRMTFKGEKMSSRLGNTPLVSDMIREVKAMVYEKTRKESMSDEDATKIAIASLKYAILRTQAGKNVNFDPETSLSFEGDSGPYLLYTYARAQSLLKKSDEDAREWDGIIPDNIDIGELERQLYQLEEILETAVLSFAPHLVLNYVTGLAQSFNSWYGNTRILQPDEGLSYRLALVEASSIVIKRALWVLGIETVDEL